MSAKEEESPPQRDWRPVPDPTELTTKALTREIANSRELLEAKLEGIGKAGDLRHQLVEEKFRGIATQFHERDERSTQTALLVSKAVDAALAAAKEAVGEQNRANALSLAELKASFAKQIDGIAVLISTTTSGADVKIDATKERLTLLEGRGSGKSEGMSSVGSIILGAIAVISFLVSMGMMFVKTR